NAKGICPELCACCLSSGQQSGLGCIGTSVGKSSLVSNHMWKSSRTPHRSAVQQCIQQNSYVFSRRFQPRVICHEQTCLRAYRCLASPNNYHMREITHKAHGRCHCQSYRKTLLFPPPTPTPLVLG
ncbi:unnamed protein product, partial [Pylaiella littoralis]